MVMMMMSFNGTITSL